MHNAMIYRQGKTTFVMGLFWQALAKPRELKKEALEIAERNDCNLYLIRAIDGIAQTGLASSSSGYAQGSVSLAAAIASGIGEKGLVINGGRVRASSWMGAFDLGNSQWAFVAVRDNAIMPTGDVLGSKEQVIDLLEQNYGLGGWSAVVGSEEIGARFHNFVGATINDFLPVKGNGQIKVDQNLVLKSIVFKVNKRIVLACTLLSLAIAGAGFGFHKWKEARDQREREEAMERVRAALAAKQPIPTKLAHPWASIPLPRDVVEACEGGAVILTPGGWKLTGYNCTSSDIKYAFKRGRSTISWLLEVLPEAKVDGTGETASLVRPLRFIEKTDEALLPAEPMKLDILDSGQKIGVKVEITEELPPPPKQKLPGEQLLSTQEEPKPEWRTFNFKFGPTKIQPSVVIGTMERPGMRITQIVKHEGQWLLTGAFYAR